MILKYPERHGDPIFPQSIALMLIRRAASELAENINIDELHEELKGQIQLSMHVVQTRAMNGDQSEARANGLASARRNLKICEAALEFVRALAENPHDEAQLRTAEAIRNAL